MAAPMAGSYGDLPCSGSAMSSPVITILIMFKVRYQVQKSLVPYRANQPHVFGSAFPILPSNAEQTAAFAVASTEHDF